MRRTILIFCLCGVANLLWAVQAIPDVLYEKQANGKELAVRLHGDEFFHFTTTDDGFLVAKNSDGNYEYAEFAENGEKVLKGVLAHNASERSLTERRFLKKQTIDFSQVNAIRKNQVIKKSASAQQKSYPLTGSPRGLVLLVEFLDIPFKITNPQQKFTDLLNQEGYSDNGGTGSARDYFTACSNGAFTPHFDVYGPFKLDKECSYYGGNTSSGDDDVSKLRQMVEDACKKAFENGVNFLEYDNDGDKILDNVFIYYAGYNEAEGGPEYTVWPHRYQVSYKIGGVTVRDYACTSELKGKTGTNMCGIGTFCHEFGHVLGLPDFYATDGGKHKTMGKWSIMSSGNYLNEGRTPPTYSAYERFFLGWIKPILLKEPAFIELEALPTSNTAYLIAKDSKHNLCNGLSVLEVKPNPTEFLLLENRQKSGWDQYLPEKGLLITRVRYNAQKITNNTVNNDENDMGYSIVMSQGSSDVFPGSYNVTGYNPTLLNGTDLEQPITHITQSNGKITFLYKGGGDGYATYEIFSNLKPFFTIAETPSEQLQEVVFKGTKLANNFELDFMNGQNFEFCLKKDSGNWQKKMTLVPVDSIILDTVLVRYFPMEYSRNGAHFDSIRMVCQPYVERFVKLEGSSTHPVKVRPPVALEAQDVKSSSFLACWKSSPYATGYYLTVFSENLDKNSSFVEGFGSLNSNKFPTDWVSTFSIQKNASTYGTASPSLVFSNSSDTLTTERYTFAVTKIAFWMQSQGATDNTFKVEAYNDSVWEKVYDHKFIRTEKVLTPEISFDEAKNYKRFRFIYEKPRQGNVLFDDFAVSFGRNVDYFKKNELLGTTDTTFTVSGVVSDTHYKYYLRATDRALDENGVLLYENITDTSNVISLTTIPENDPTKLKVKTVGNDIFVEIPPDKWDKDKVGYIFIYDINGHLVCKFEPKERQVQLPADLPKRTLLIVSYSPENRPTRKDPKVKFFDNSQNK